jgi:hypothetical protein
MSEFSVNFSIDDFFGKLVFQIILDVSADKPCALRRVKALVRQ